MRRMLSITLLVATLLTVLSLVASQSAAQASPAVLDTSHTVALVSSPQALSSTPRTRALAWARTQIGCWYHYGHTGPCSSGYDCSGFVYASYRHVGFYFGRDTYDMRHSSRLVRVKYPYPGDLAFFGTGHVELYLSGTLYHGTTLGAHHSGTRVSVRKYNSYYHPTAFYHVYGAR